MGRRYGAGYGIEEAYWGPSKIALIWLNLISCQCESGLVTLVYINGALVLRAARDSKEIYMVFVYISHFSLTEKK